MTWAWILFGIAAIVGVYFIGQALQTQAQANLAQQNGVGGQIGDAFNGLGAAAKSVGL